MQMTVEKCRVKMEVNYMGSIEIKQSVSRSSVASIWVKKRQDNWAKNDGINWALNLARNWRVRGGSWREQPHSSVGGRAFIIPNPMGEEELQQGRFCGGVNWPNFTAKSR